MCFVVWSIQEVSMFAYLPRPQCVLEQKIMTSSPENPHCGVLENEMLSLSHLLPDFRVLCFFRFLDYSKC